MSESRQVEILSHMVGGDKRYRNYFAAEIPSDDYQTLVEMETEGLVWRRESTAYELTIFHATPKGLEMLS